MSIKRRQVLRGSSPPPLYDGEFFQDTDDGSVYIGHNGGSVMVSNNVALQAQINDIKRKKILDVPAELSGRSRNVVRVKADETGFEFVDFASSIDFLSARNVAEQSAAIALQAKVDAVSASGSAADSSSEAEGFAESAGLSASIAQSSVAGIGSDSIVSAPVVGEKTIIATAASVFAGSSRLSGRSKLTLRNDDQSIRIRVGPESVTQQSGMPIEPGGFVEFLINRAEAVEVFAISEGAAVRAEVWES